MALGHSSIPAVLRQRVRHQPDAIAYTFFDYDVDPAGFAESWTWSQVHRRARVVAEELSRCGSTGDRAAILAPQGLEYVIAFLGALEAGFVAVPLSVPAFGTHDERVSGALRDCSPAAILTTSAVVGAVMPYAVAQSAGSAPAVVEVDALDLDAPATLDTNTVRHPEAAYLQYTSGSTRQPAGVVISHRNLLVNFEQLVPDYFEAFGGVVPPGTTVVSWLPFYHDMGLLQGVLGPVMLGCRAVLMSPIAFLQKPARWMQLMAGHSGVFTAGPNFAFELAARRTSDDDMAGLDLGDVRAITNGAERVQPATIQRFAERFARCNLPAAAVRPAYGLAEATLYVVASAGGHPPVTAHFDYEKLSAGHARRCGGEGGSVLVGHGRPRARSMSVRIVDPDARTENPDEKVGEIWVHGDNVATGYWGNPQATGHSFGARLAYPLPGTPEGPWLRTGDLGVLSEDQLFIVGRIKDLLIVDGRNHYPEDIEATIQEVTRGRVAAISVPNPRGERLVAIIEVKEQGGGDEEAQHRFRTVKLAVTSAVWTSHGVPVADLVLVAPGAIPITTSGKIRRSACAEHYRDGRFTRLDATG